MRLASTISLHAGGEGSGCHGPNCGRKGSPEGHKPDSSTTSATKSSWKGSESYQELAKRYPDMHEKMMSAQSSLDMAKITREYNKAMDADKEPMAPGPFKEMMRQHKERLAEGDAKVDTRTSKERQADRIGSYLTDVNRHRRDRR